MVDQLEAAARGDKKAEAWVINLAKHYEKLGLCNRRVAM